MRHERRDIEEGIEIQQGSSVLLSAAAATFLLGLAYALRRTSKQARSIPVPFFRSNIHALDDPSFSPVLHAAKALGVGTFLCCGTATVLTWAGSLALDVRTLPEFSMRMRQILGRAAPKLQQRLRSVEAQEATSQAQAGEREWAAVWEEGRRIDAERAAYKRRRKEQKQGSGQDQGQTGQAEQESAAAA